MVFICSPYRGDVEQNTMKAKRYCRFAFANKKLPIAPHLVFTCFLQDDIHEEREAGILMGLELLGMCKELWCFGNRITEGMKREIDYASKTGIPVRHFTEACQEVGQCDKAT